MGMRNATPQPAVQQQPDVQVIANTPIESAAKPGNVVDPNAVAPHIPVKLEGGPEGEVIAAEETPAPAGTPIFTYGTKSFNTPEELKAFIDQLDRKAAKNEGYEEAMRQVQPAPPVPENAPVLEPGAEAPPMVIDGKNINELIWENPAEALTLVQKQAVEKATETVEARDATRRELDKFWDDFYSKNKDLSDVKDHVDMVLTKNMKRLSPMDAEAAKTELATLTRAELVRVRDKFKETENLGNSPAIVAPSTAASSPAIPEPEVVKNVAFIDQVKQYQSKYFTDRVS